MSAAAQGENYAYLDTYLQPGLTNWTTYENPRQPPQREGELIPEIGNTLLELSHRHIGRDIEQLKTFYIFCDANVIERFLTDHRSLPGILLAAIEPLKNSFGSDSVFRLEVIADQDNAKMLYAVALWRGTVRAAAQALDNFAEKWWLDHMTPNTANLAFIFRICR